MDYDKMLNKAYEDMPSIVFEKKRFEVPKVRASVEGNKTVFKNAKEIEDYLNRDKKHILKFICKEMGAAWRKENSRTVFIGKFSSRKIGQRLDRYVKEYVLCPVCGKPDTKLKKVDRISVLKCLACGATNPVKQL